MDIKLINLIKNANNSPVLSKFLTLDEQKNLVSKEVQILFSSSYLLEERKRAFLFPNSYPDYANYTNYANNINKIDFKISFLKISSNSKLTKFKHPDILGALMSLGITREVIGDIIVTEDASYIICATEIEKYIIDNLTQISKVSVSLEHVDKLDIDSQNNYESIEIIISSMRLDAIISKSINTSREKAKELIAQRIVKINGNICTDNDYVCKENDIISIIRFGRIIIRENTRKTKKDKLVLKVERTI